MPTTLTVQTRNIFSTMIRSFLWRNEPLLLKCDGKERLHMNYLHFKKFSHEEKKIKHNIFEKKYLLSFCHHISLSVYLSVYPSVSFCSCLIQYLSVCHICTVKPTQILFDEHPIHKSVWVCLF